MKVQMSYAQVAEHELCKATSYRKMYQFHSEPGLVPRQEKFG